MLKCGFVGMLFLKKKPSLQNEYRQHIYVSKAAHKVII